MSLRTFTANREPHKTQVYSHLKHSSLADSTGPWGETDKYPLLVHQTRKVAGVLRMGLVSFGQRSDPRRTLSEVLIPSSVTPQAPPRGSDCVLAS